MNNSHHKIAKGTYSFWSSVTVILLLRSSCLRNLPSSPNQGRDFALFCPVPAWTREFITCYFPSLSETDDPDCSDQIRSQSTIVRPYSFLGKNSRVLCGPKHCRGLPRSYVLIWLHIFQVNFDRQIVCPRLNATRFYSHFTRSNCTS